MVLPNLVLPRDPIVRYPIMNDFYIDVTHTLQREGYVVISKCWSHHFLYWKCRSGLGIMHIRCGVEDLD